jgi:flagellar P-ring protein precursor FlgI
VQRSNARCPTQVGEGEFIHLETHTTDFGTTQRMVEAINAKVLPGTAVAVDARRIQVRAPLDPGERVAFMSRIENLDVTPALQAAKVIVNSRTGSVVMNQAVTLDACAVAHGNLTVTVSAEPVVSQPAPLSADRLW